MQLLTKNELVVDMKDLSYDIWTDKHLFPH